MERWKICAKTCHNGSLIWPDISDTFLSTGFNRLQTCFCGDNLHERCATFEFIYQRESELLLLLLLLLFGLCCDPISDKFPNHINRQFTALFVRPIGKLRHNVLTCTGQYKYKKENLRAYIHAPTGIRTHDQYSSGRETRADCAATVIGRDNCLIISLIGFDEAEV